jgi:hypothetical protein
MLCFSTLDAEGLDAEGYAWKKSLKSNHQRGTPGGGTGRRRHRLG